jgi:hypothetical protein
MALTRDELVEEFYKKTYLPDARAPALTLVLNLSLTGKK